MLDLQVIFEHCTSILSHGSVHKPGNTRITPAPISSVLFTTVVGRRPQYSALRSTEYSCSFTHHTRCLLHNLQGRILAAAGHSGSSNSLCILVGYLGQQAGLYNSKDAVSYCNGPLQTDNVPWSACTTVECYPSLSEAAYAEPTVPAGRPKKRPPWRRSFVPGASSACCRHWQR